MSAYKIAASILSSDLALLSDQLALLESAKADWIHVDVMDGMFVPNISFGPVIVAACRRYTRLPIDAHLMIEKPERYVDQFAEAGANSISVHIEGNPNVHRTIQAIKQNRCMAGIVINPATPVSALEAILLDVDYVLVMSVNPGFSGQTFLESTLSKIAALKKMTIDYGCDIPIQVDGGISRENIGEIRNRGARIFVAASSIFTHPEGVIAGVKSLRNALN